MNFLRMTSGGIGLMWLVGCSGAAATLEATSPPLPEATEGPTPVPTPLTEQAQLVGEWRGNRFSQLYIAFNEDGSVFWTDNLDDLASDPAIVGEYWFEEGQLHLRDVGGPFGPEDADDPCAGVGIYEIAFYPIRDSGMLRFTAIEDPCQDRNDALQGREGLDILVEFSPVP